MNTKLMHIESMIPILDDTGDFIGHPKAVERSYKNAIVNNFIKDDLDLRQLILISEKILGSNYLEKLLYDKLEYLGFEPCNVEVVSDMSFKSRTICFCSNYMFYYQTRNEKLFLTQIKKLTGKI